MLLTECYLLIFDNITEMTLTEIGGKGKRKYALFNQKLVSTRSLGLRRDTGKYMWKLESERREEFTSIMYFGLQIVTKYLGSFIT